LRLSSHSIFEAPAIVSGLDDAAVAGQTIQQRAGHFGIGKNARPFAEGKICGGDDRGPLIELADQIEQQLAAGLSEGQIAELVNSRDGINACRTTKSLRSRYSGNRRLRRPGYRAAPAFRR
jgi:hypothetical protein